MPPLSERTLIILPCSKRKTPQHGLPERGLPAQFNQAIATLRNVGNQQARPVCNVEGNPTPALWLYDGHLYRQLQRDQLDQAMQEGWLDIVILSGGYGMVHAYEPIQEYEATMNRHFKHWLAAGLPNALQAYIEITRPRNVLAFLTHTNNQPAAYGPILDQGAGQAAVDGVSGKYVAIPAGRWRQQPLRDLGGLVMQVVTARRGGEGVPRVDFIPFQAD